MAPELGTSVEEFGRCPPEEGTVRGERALFVLGVEDVPFDAIAGWRSLLGRQRYDSPVRIAHDGARRAGRVTLEGSELLGSRSGESTQRIVDVVDANVTKPVCRRSARRRALGQGNDGDGVPPELRAEELGVELARGSDVGRA
jgi:hypothetical protein